MNNLIKIILTILIIFAINKNADAFRIGGFERDSDGDPAFTYYNDDCYPRISSIAQVKRHFTVKIIPAICPAVSSGVIKLQKYPNTLVVYKLR